MSLPFFWVAPQSVLRVRDHNAEMKLQRKDAVGGKGNPKHRQPSCFAGFQVGLQVHFIQMSA